MTIVKCEGVLNATVCTPSREAPVINRLGLPIISATHISTGTYANCYKVGGVQIVQAGVLILSLGLDSFKPEIGR